MGLDMYLKASCYIGGWEHSGEAEKALYAALLGQLGLKVPICEGSPSVTVSVNVAYWRKANQIHGWFVANVQDGKDECQEAYVEREKLVELRDLAKRAADEKNSELLTPQGGFFFGSTEIDDWYWRDLEHTVEQLDAVLNNPVFEKGGGWSFYYHSSW